MPPTPRRAHTPLPIAFRRPWPGTRRGFKLWLFSIIIGLKGYGYVGGHSPASTDSALRFVTALLPLEAWGAIIMTICAFAAFCSYCHHGRDQYGYMGLVGFSFAWMSCYLVGVWFRGAPDYGYQGALSWAVIGGLLLYSADDPDPEPAAEACQ